jgi:hypothetical protein
VIASVPKVVDEAVFKITPETVDIDPNQSFTFTATFHPKQSNRNFLSEIEAVVFFKNQRTFRLTDDSTLTPPWTLTVRTLGHTFSTGQLLAKGHFSGGGSESIMNFSAIFHLMMVNVLGAIRHGKLTFPCGCVDESIYETIVLQNTSNMPCTFQLNFGWQNEGYIYSLIFFKYISFLAIEMSYP